MIILSQEIVVSCLKQVGPQGQITIPFTVVDEGDIFTCIQLIREVAHKRPSVLGTLQFFTHTEDMNIEPSFPDDSMLFIAVDSSDFHCKAWIKRQRHIETSSLQLIPLKAELYSRAHGLYETDVLKAKTVLIVGLGSGGSLTALELAKAGVGHFILIDHERLEVANIARHSCGLSDLGRYKTKAVRDLILDKNPFAQVETYQQQCTWDWLPPLLRLVRQVDLVFCCTDSRESRTIINRACILENRICIYGGVFKRAYGGHALRVVPKKSICYQCFLSILPEQAEDEEITSDVQVKSFSYGNTYSMVTIEPGLATDIAPISNFCVKLGILEMLRGTPTSLSTLNDDLTSPWFQWLNRREPGTAYAELEPMDTTENYRILAWYGIPLARNPRCPVCGDYQLNTSGIELSDENATVLQDFFQQFSSDQELQEP